MITLPGIVLWQLELHKPHKHHRQRLLLQLANNVRHGCSEVRGHFNLTHFSPVQLVRLRQLVCLRTVLDLLERLPVVVTQMVMQQKHLPILLSKDALFILVTAVRLNSVVNNDTLSEHW